jgi:hypothetical protein
MQSIDMAVFLLLWRDRRAEWQASRAKATIAGRQVGAITQISNSPYYTAWRGSMSII